MNSIALSKRKDFAVYRATWVFVAALCLLILQALQATAQMMPNTFADLADEISPDGCRLWDLKTGEKMDKDRFRRDLGNVMDAYREVLSRLQARISE